MAAYADVGQFTYVEVARQQYELAVLSLVVRSSIFGKAHRL
jgi:hypothetical protein